MKITFREIKNNQKKENICRSIINDLPLWFGISESNQEYSLNVKKYDFIGIYDEQEEIGFVSIKNNNEFVAELYVLGIIKKYHHKGIGTKVIDYICKDLRKKGIKYLEVKTLDGSKESEEYRKTRMFYEKIGFIPLDTLKNEWGEENPCLIMIKKL